MRRPALLLTCLAAGCAGAPPAAVDETPPGVATEVQVIDSGFVSVDGRRMGLEWFLLEMRDRTRDAHGDVDKLPRLVIRIPEGAPGVNARWLDNLQTELQKAGIRHVDLGGT